MTRKKKGRREDKPALETETYRMWDATGMTPKEQEEAKKVSLGVFEGERIHEIVIFNVAAEHTVKVVSKQRIKDGRIQALIKIEKPGDRCSIIRCGAWITGEEYNGLVRAMKKRFGEQRATVIPGENLHIGLSHVVNNIERKKRQEENKRGRKAPDSPPRIAHREYGGD